MSRPSQARSRVVELVLMALLAASGALPAFALEVHRFDIPEEEAATAIRDFGEQAHVQILVAGEAVKGKKLHAVTGRLSTEDGLNALLSGSGLTHQYVGDHSIALLAAQATAASTQAQGGASSDPQEGKSNSSGKFLLAQTPSGQDQGNPSVEKQEEDTTKKKEFLQEVIVTGSRIPTKPGETAWDVKTYTQANIENSGQSTVTGFLNTLPDVSVVSTPNVFQNFDGVTTVQLHGLPAGSTLVLLNGRRVENSGLAQINVFNLSNFPLAAVERIDVVSVGSSAIYGSDALAGIVNIILKTDFKGFEFKTEYGGASGTDDARASAAWGEKWDRGSVSLVASFQRQSELTGSERSLTSNSDFRAYGGIDARSFDCNPGNVFSLNGNPLPGAPPNPPPGADYSFAAVAPNAAGNPKQTGFMGTYGQLNRCTPSSSASVIPPSQQSGIFASANFRLTTTTELFAELMFSYTHTIAYTDAQELFGVPGFTLYTVSASNPYNPFGEDVGISGQLAGVPRPGDTVNTTLVRPLVGVRGNLSSWYWELAGWVSKDSTDTPANVQLNSTAVQDALNSSNPATALNPFVSGPFAPAQLLQTLLSPIQQKYAGQTSMINGFIRGPLGYLPSGPVQVVFGGEYTRESIYNHIVVDPFIPPGLTNFSRHSDAVFGEARIPLLSARANAQGRDRLAVSLAARYNHYSDFGGKTTPEFGLEWRPWDTLLLRSAFGRSFKAPYLRYLDAPIVSSGPISVVDPLTGQQAMPQGYFGGNPRLQPETGQSTTFGLVYSPTSNLRTSLTHWKVIADDSIQVLQDQALVDNETLFPSNVIRGPGQGGQPGPIIQVFDTYVNFGSTTVEGFDSDINYRIPSKIGEWALAAGATETYRYRTALLPGLPATDRVSKAVIDGNFAPRWKGTASLGWSRRSYGATFLGRYLGHYLDYQEFVAPNDRQLGGFWLFDVNLHYAVGQVIAHESTWLAKTSIDVGGSNVFNRQPQYSDFAGGFVGYDPAEADLIGRFLYARLRVSW